MSRALACTGSLRSKSVQYRPSTSNSQVTPHHLLAALLEQDGGIVAPVLRRANADPEAVRRRANEALDALPTVTGDATDAPALSNELIQLLQQSDDEARSLIKVVVSDAS